MGGLLFSITLSVSLVTIILLAMKESIIKKYGVCWFSEDRYIIVPYDQSESQGERIEYTIDEYLKTDGNSVLLFQASRDKGGFMQLNRHLLWIEGVTMHDMAEAAYEE